VARRNISLLLAGDALITRPWSHVRDAAFLKLIEEIRASDVAIVNLETVIHEFKGYAQADSGGSYMASPPEIATELKWAGFDMLVHANNHAFDYGTSGVLETNEHVEKSGLILAGSGKDLQTARAPRYLRSDGGTVALVAMASDFVRYGKASKSRPDLRGRPGVNPLAVTHARAARIPVPMASRLRSVARNLGFRRHKLEARLIKLGLRSSHHVEITDLQANLDAISAAASNADVVIASVHAHTQGQWLTKFSHQAIEHGACAVFVHGPHEVRGIELYHRKPIFYSLGNFVYEIEHIRRFPAEEYERLGLASDASVSELRSAKAKLVTGLSRERSNFEGMVASISISAGNVIGIRLIPTDLQFDSEGEGRGRPQLACRELGKKIIEKLIEDSWEYGTQIRYDPMIECGEVVLN
jgi:poly-gamma-glutamate capsule biosynthesis protein CapA/YwtB (metallophosphatase superfamily)